MLVGNYCSIEIAAASRNPAHVVQQDKANLKSDSTIDARFGTYSFFLPIAIYMAVLIHRCLASQKGFLDNRLLLSDNVAYDRVGNDC